MQTDLEFTREMTAFFEAIPDDMWCTRDFISPDGRRCAMGHVLNYSLLLHIGRTPIENRLQGLFSRHLNLVVENVNDGAALGYVLGTPKFRILAALKDIEEKILTAGESEREGKSAAIQSELALAQAKQIINEPVQELCSK